MASKGLTPVIDRLAVYFVKHPRLLLGVVIAYVICPIDLLPEAFIGPAGYLDDILVMLVPLVIRGYAKKLSGRTKNSNGPETFDTTAR